MADSWTTPEHDAEAASQKEIAAQLPEQAQAHQKASDAEAVAEAPAVAGETADLPDPAAFQGDEPVSIVLAADATADYVDPETGEVSQEAVNEISIAGVVLKPGEPVEVESSVARGIVASEDNVEVAA